MGGIAGIGAAVGGMGDAALDYGRQIRGLLEQRRGAMAHMIGEAAQNEPDPSKRSELLQHQADLLAGKPMGKLAGSIIKTLQTHVQDNHAMAEAIGGPPEQPKPVPGPAQPGQVAGTLQPPPSTGGTAAQPPTSPVSPAAQTSPSTSQPQTAAIPPVGQPAPAPIQPIGGIHPQDDAAIVQRYMSHPQWGAPANRPALTQAMAHELQSNELLRQKTQEPQIGIHAGMQRLEMMGDPAVRARVQSLVAGGMPHEMAEFTVASALGIPVPFASGMMRSAMVPDRMELTADEVLQKWPEFAQQAGITPGKHPVQVLLSRIDHQPTQVGAKAFPERFMPGTDAQGNSTIMAVSPYQGQGPIAPVGGFTPTPSVNITPHTAPTASGGVEQYTAAGLHGGQAPTAIPGAVAPAMLPSTTSSNSLKSIDTVDAQGNHVTLLQPVQTSSTRTKGAAGAIPPVGGSLPPLKTSGSQQFYKPLTSSTQTMREAAPKVLDLANRLSTMIDSQKASLGPLASRWSEFWSGKVGAPNAEFTKLRTDAGLLQTLLMRMHVGARGGTEIMMHFKDLIDAGKQSPENMKAAIQEITQYANAVGSEMPGSINPPKGTPATPTVTHRFNPATGKIEEVKK